MNDLAYTEALIARYKKLYQSGASSMTSEAVRELLRITTTLTERGFTVTADGKDWLPPFTPDAE